MSRIGKKPVAIPAGVEVNIDGSVVTVKGPKGTLTKEFNHLMKISKQGDEVIVERPDEENLSKSLHGLTRTLIHNMVEGVTNGFSKELKINGVGYRCQKSGKNVTLTLGYSHPVIVSDSDDITLDVPDPNTIIVKGIDKQKVGQIASEIRGKRPPEPYKGKGIKYAKLSAARKVKQVRVRSNSHNERTENKWLKLSTRTRAESAVTSVFVLRSPVPQSARVLTFSVLLSTFTLRSLTT